MARELVPEEAQTAQAVRLPRSRSMGLDKLRLKTPKLWRDGARELMVLKPPSRLACDCAELRLDCCTNRISSTSRGSPALLGWGQNRLLFRIRSASLRRLPSYGGMGPEIWLLESWSKASLVRLTGSGGMNLSFPTGASA